MRHLTATCDELIDMRSMNDITDRQIAERVNLLDRGQLEKWAVELGGKEIAGILPKFDDSRLKALVVRGIADAGDAQ